MKKINNKGFSLTIVVLAMLLTSVVLTATLVIVMANYRTKTRTLSAEQNTVMNAETCMEYVRLGLEQVCQEELDKAYRSVMSEYTEIPEDKLNEELRRRYIDNLIDCFDEVAPYHDKTLTSLKLGVIAKAETILSAYGINIVNISDEQFYTNLVDAAYFYDTDSSSSSTDIEVYKKKGLLTIPSLALSYASKDSSSTVTSDFIFEAPNLFGKIIVEDTDKVQSLCKYTVIADSDLNLKSNGSISGSLYAGGDIFCNASVNLQGKNILARGNLLNDTSSSLSIIGDSIYVHSIENDGNLNIDSNKVYSLSELINRGSFKVSGSFIGTTIKQYDGSLDLTGLDELVLSDTVSIYNDNLQTGFSLYDVGLDKIYLVPDVCIISDSDDKKAKKKEYTNPINEDDLSKIKVDYTKYKELDLSKYTSKVLTLKKGDKVYLFMALGDNISDYENEVGYKSDNIIFNTACKIYTAGKLSTRDGVVFDVISDSKLIKTKRLKSDWNSLLSTLQTGVTGRLNSSLFDWLVNDSAIFKDSDMIDSTTFSCSSVQYYKQIDDMKVLVADGDVRILRGFKGAVICTGDIYINTSSQIDGSLICRGSLTSEFGINIVNDNSSLLKIIQADDNIKGLFVGVDSNKPYDYELVEVRNYAHS